MKTVRAVVQEIGRLIKRVRKPLSYAIAIVIFGFLCIRLYQSWQTLPEDFWATHPIDVAQILISVVLMLLAYFMMSSGWFLTLRALNENITWRVSTKIWFSSLAMRYLPGLIWGYLGRAYLSVDQSVAKRSVVVSLVAESVLLVVSEMIVFAVSLWLWVDQNVRIVSVGVFALCLIGFGAFVWISGHPWLRERLVIWPKLRSMSWPTVQPIVMLRLLGYYTFSVLAVGLAFYWLVNAIYPIPFWEILVLTGMLSFASTVGFLFPLSPQGWGVREAILVGLLIYNQFPQPIALAIGLGSRLWTIIGEFIWIGLATRL